jgi:hypothetical protein
MQLKNAEREKNNARSGRFEKQIGSTLYQVNVYFDTAGREPLEDKILRLIKGDLEFGTERTDFRNPGNTKMALPDAEKQGIIGMLQMGRLPERGAV